MRLSSTLALFALALVPFSTAHIACLADCPDAAPEAHFDGLPEEHDPCDLLAVTLYTHVRTADVNLIVRDEEGNIRAGISGSTFGSIFPATFDPAPTLEDVWPAGNYTLEGVATNEHGASATVATIRILPFVDETPPVSTLDDGRDDEPIQGWYSAPVHFELRAEDDCRLPTTAQLLLDGAPAVGASVVASSEGAHVIAYRSIDASGNEEEWRELAFGIDRSPPQVVITAPASGDVYAYNVRLLSGADRTVVAGNVPLRAAASDAYSGISSIIWRVDGLIIGHGSSMHHEFTPGTHHLTVTVIDRVGHAAVDAVNVIAVSAMVG